MNVGLVVSLQASPMTYVTCDYWQRTSTLKAPSHHVAWGLIKREKIKTVRSISFLCLSYMDMD